MPTDPTLKADLERHQPILHDGAALRSCVQCPGDQLWPCDASRALAELEVAEQVQHDLAEAAVRLEKASREKDGQIAALVGWLGRIGICWCEYLGRVCPDCEEGEDCDDCHMPTDIAAAAKAHDDEVARRAVEAVLNAISAGRICVALDNHYDKDPGAMWGAALAIADELRSGIRAALLTPVPNEATT